MAPEQLEGREADARTDIFAFGAVLYEMLTRKKAFEGKNQASLIGAILHIDPPAVTTVRPLLPPFLDRLVQKCLRKDADHRWQTARDLLDELKWIAEGGTAIAPVGARTRNPWLERAAWLASAGAFLVLALYVATSRGPSASTGDLVRFPVYSPDKTVFSGPAVVTVGQPQFALLPDGRALAFAAAAAGAERFIRRVTC